jgi:hypothetical protein
MLLAHMNRDLPGILVTPTYQMAKRTHAVEWPMVMKDLGINLVWLPGKQAFRWPWGAITWVVSAENPQRLAGPNMAYVLYDEPGQMDREAWERGSGRARHPRASLRQVILAGTPEGINWFADLFDEPEGRRRTIRAHQWHRDMAHYPQQLVDIYGYDQNLLAAYAKGQFVPLRKGRCFLAFSRHEHVTEKAVYSPHLPIVVFCDFNVDFMRWTLGHVTNKEIIAFDEIAMPNGCDTAQTAKLFVEYYGGKHKGEVIVTGDATGYHRSTTGEVDYHKIKEEFRKADFANIRFVIPKANPRQRERVDTMNYHFAGRGRRVVINPVCKQLVRDCERVVWSKSRIEIDKGDESLTHSSEGFSLGVYQLAPVIGLQRAVIATKDDTFKDKDLIHGAQF